VLTCGFVRDRLGGHGDPGGCGRVFGYLILRQVLQLLLQVMRGERSKEIEILVLRHQLVVLRRQVVRLDLEPFEDRDLVSQGEDLGVLVSVTHGKQPQYRQRVGHTEVVGAENSVAAIDLPLR
jgi:hypothetical protein